MEKISLIKREHIGEGYCYTLKNPETEELITTLCSKKDYEAGNNWVTPEGFVFVSSGGGFPLLDSGMGKLNDGFIRDGEYYVFEPDASLGGILTLNKYSEEEFNKKYTWQ